MRMRRIRSFTEACVFGGCLMLVFFSLAQVFILSNRSRQPRAASVTEVKQSKTPAHEETKPQPQVPPDIGIIRQRDALKRALSSPVNSAAKAKLLARTKAQQEVRELERSLVKLMRQNSRTPEQSKAEMETELYALRVGRIIQQVAEESSKVGTTSGSEPNPVHAVAQDPQSGLASNNLGVIASQRRAFSDMSVSEHRNGSHAAPIPRSPPGQNHLELVPLDIHSASLEHNPPAVSGKRDAGVYAKKAQDIFRTAEPLRAVHEVGRVGDANQVLDDSNDTSYAKKDVGLSEHSPGISEREQRLARLRPKSNVLCTAEPDNLGELVSM
ncbi:hypothetical protein ElyMa_001750000 [Elysia marginata]|uniref:Uncharacterized protein n=1 Tax=Elysia marginata TaxID=1093978 RepID=A0AAV4E9D7_9GAST|nr:hypothetical protein ElyMa_001750000 [Elysia marginata]